MIYCLRFFLIINLAACLSGCLVTGQSIVTKNSRELAISIRQLTTAADRYDNKAVLVYGCIQDIDGPDPSLIFDMDYSSPFSHTDKILYMEKIPKSMWAGLQTQKSTPANKQVYPRVIVSGIFHSTPIIPHSPAWAFKGVDEGNIGYLSAPSIAHVYPDQCVQAL